MTVTRIHKSNTGHNSVTSQLDGILSLVLSESEGLGTVYQIGQRTIRIVNAAAFMNQSSLLPDVSTLTSEFERIRYLSNLAAPFIEIHYEATLTNSFDLMEILDRLDPACELLVLDALN